MELELTKVPGSGNSTTASNLPPYPGTVQGVPVQNASLTRVAARKGRAGASSTGYVPQHVSPAGVKGKASFQRPKTCFQTDFPLLVPVRRFLFHRVCTLHKSKKMAGKIN
eukprot:1515764-Rhodomonas_salina.1